MASSSGIDLYIKLKTEMYDDNEQRLSLWLPLSINEKLDMIMHQRNPDEMEIMIYLLNQEYNLTENFGISEKFDTLLERSLDLQVFNKYHSFARLKAFDKSLQLCLRRLSHVLDEDTSALEYAAFLRERHDHYTTLMIQLEAELSKTKRRNDKKRLEIGEQEKEL